MFAILGDAAAAYNAISWADAIPFLICIIGLYYIKVRIDASVGLGKKKSKELKRIIVDAIVEGHQQAHRS
tara:strand:+ start:913 stop:1122 length:210 start_codon:yes stop_codon:yes gene_type:complete